MSRVASPFFSSRLIRTDISSAHVPGFFSRSPSPGFREPCGHNLSPHRGAVTVTWNGRAVSLQGAQCSNVLGHCGRCGSNEDGGATCRKMLATSPSTTSGTCSTWSCSRSMLVAREGQEQQFSGRARLLDRRVVSSVSGAVEKLNSGTVHCPEDFCIVYSAQCRSYYLLYRCNRKNEARQALRLKNRSAICKPTGTNQPNFPSLATQSTLSPGGAARSLQNLHASRMSLEGASERTERKTFVCPEATPGKSPAAEVTPQSDSTRTGLSASISRDSLISSPTLPPTLPPTPRNRRSVSLEAMAFSPPGTGRTSAGDAFATTSETVPETPEASAPTTAIMSCMKLDCQVSLTCRSYSTPDTSPSSQARRFCTPPAQVRGNFGCHTQGAQAKEAEVGHTDSTGTSGCRMFTTCNKETLSHRTLHEVQMQQHFRPSRQFCTGYRVNGTGPIQIMPTPQHLDGIGSCKRPGLLCGSQQVEALGTASPGTRCQPAWAFAKGNSAPAARWPTPHAPHGVHLQALTRSAGFLSGL